MPETPGAAFDKDRSRNHNNRRPCTKTHPSVWSCWGMYSSLRPEPRYLRLSACIRNESQQFLFPQRKLGKSKNIRQALAPFPLFHKLRYVNRSPAAHRQERRRRSSDCFLSFLRTRAGGDCRPRENPSSCSLKFRFSVFLPEILLKRSPARRFARSSRRIQAIRQKPPA